MGRMVVGAHYGLKDWLAQRITAVLMAIYAVVIFVAILCGVTSSAQAWRDFMSHGAVQFISLLFILSLGYHAWVGVRDIWMDYIKNTALRLTLQVKTAVILIFYFIWSVAILWG
jgi:succinate dehydrogenase / fumarate reductase membrane anchor subunit